MRQDLRVGACRIARVPLMNVNARPDVTIAELSRPAPQTQQALSQVAARLEKLGPASGASSARSGPRRRTAPHRSRPEARAHAHDTIARLRLCSSKRSAQAATSDSSSCSRATFDVFPLPLAALPTARGWPPPPRLACARHARTLSALGRGVSKTLYQHAATISAPGTLASDSAHRCERPSPPCGRGRHAEAAAHVAAAQQSPGGPATKHKALLPVAVRLRITRRRPAERDVAATAPADPAFSAIPELGQAASGCRWAVGRAAPSR